MTILFAKSTLQTTIRIGHSIPTSGTCIIPASLFIRAPYCISCHPFCVVITLAFYMRATQRGFLGIDNCLTNARNPQSRTCSGIRVYQLTFPPLGICDLDMVKNVVSVEDSGSHRPIVNHASASRPLIRLLSTMASRNRADLRQICRTGTCQKIPRVLSVNCL